MLSILATLIIGISGFIVFFIDQSETAFGLSFVALVCACAITLQLDYSKDDPNKLGRLKICCIVSQVMICIQFGIAGLRVKKDFDFDQGDRLTIITLVNFVVAELFLVYGIIRSITTFKNTKERTPLTNQTV